MDIDGKKVASIIKNSIKENIQKTSCHPCLVFILVGENPASQTYVRMKSKAAKEVGIRSLQLDLPEEISEKDLVKQIQILNQDEMVHGILVQMPLPKHIDEKVILHTIDPKKDVDGFHPINVGKMLMGDPDAFISCTPFGILKLLEHYEVSTKGKHIVVVGRSNIVGRPIANLLSQKAPYGNATVTLAHSYTTNLKEICLLADILIVAIGIPKLIKEDMVKEGAVVIDVGINRTATGLVGDVDYENVSRVASLITPVPGGVGPMTIAMLLSNTLKACLTKANMLR